MANAGVTVCAMNAAAVKSRRVTRRRTLILLRGWLPSHSMTGILKELRHDDALSHLFSVAQSKEDNEV